MKKSLTSILALSSLLLSVSCQKEISDSGRHPGEVEFSITAEVPGRITTYASDDGGATNVDKDVYDQRFILEVYDDDGVGALAYRETKTAELGEKVSFDIRLLAKKIQDCPMGGLRG